MPRVEIYVKMSCPYCIRALRLLDEKGIRYDRYILDSSEKRHEMIERANGRTTVPQIFIDNQHVGGCDDLFALERQGRLDQLLAA